MLLTSTELSNPLLLICRNDLSWLRGCLRRPMSRYSKTAKNGITTMISNHAIMLVGFDKPLGKQIDQSTVVFVNELKESW